MKRRVILNTGPLVALLNRHEAQHGWVKDSLGEIEPPLTCEAVVSEACFLLRGFRGGQRAVMETLSTGLVQIAFKIGENVEPIEVLLERYASVPMSLADACLVRMTERYPESSVLTFDGGFYVYRKNRSEVIPLLIPERWVK